MSVLIRVRGNGPVYFDDPDVRLALIEGRRRSIPGTTVAAQVLRSWFERAWSLGLSAERIQRGKDWRLGRYRTRNRIRKRLERVQVVGSKP